MVDATLGATGGALTLRASASGLVLPDPAPRLLAGSPIRLDATLHLDEPTRPIEIAATQRLLSVQAQAVTAGERSVTFEVRVPDVAPFTALAGGKSTAPAALRKVSGSLAASGTLAETAAGARLDLDARTAGLRAPPALASLLGSAPRLQLSASWTDRAIEVGRLLLTGQALTLSGNGTAQLAAAGAPGASGSQSGLPSLRARWNLSVPALAAVSPALSGTLNVTGALNGPIRALAAQVQAASTLSIRGSPQGTLDASLQLRGLPSALTGSLEAQGSFDGAPLDLQASLEPGAGGLLHLTVQRTNWKSVHIDANVSTGANLAQASGSLNLNIGRLADLQPLIGRPLEGSIAGSVTLSPDAGRTHAQLRVEAHDVGDSGVSANAVLTGSGPIDALPLQLSAQSPNVGGAPASLEAAVRLSLTSRVLTLEKVEAGYHGASLRLLSPARLAFKDGLRVSGLKLGLQHATLSAEGEISPALDLSASVSRVDAALVNGFAPDLLAQGTLDAEARLTGTLSAPEGRATLEVIGLRMANSAARHLPALDLKATAELGGTAAQVDAQLTAGRASQLKLTGQAPLTAAGALSLKLSGKLDAALANPLLEAHGERAAGTFEVDATVTGPAQAPQIGGSIELTHGDIRDYAQGVHFDDVTARLTGGQGILRIASLTAHAGAGQVSMTGTLGLLKSKMPIDVELHAKNAQPITSDILTANLDADIHLEGTLRQRIDVTGTVHLNRAQIGIPNSLPPNVAVLDVRRPGETPPQSEKRRLTIGLDVSLAAPREILVQGRGFDAELGGSLTIHGTSAAPQVRGGFELIMGTFTLASTQLNFTQGEVSFNGAGLRGKIDPTLDFTAQATAADATVTLRVTGLADAPRFTLTSSPQLPQDEILARLLFGESASQLTGLQVAEIGAALASLSGIGGGSGLNPLGKIQKALGLNRLTVGSATTTSANGTPQTSGASVTAGRYVSSRVFVAATQNTTGTSQLQVDIDLTKHLKLQTKLGNGSATAQGTTPENDPGSSVGLSYQFEY
jgi:translocation and assembly module TamB